MKQNTGGGSATREQRALYYKPLEAPMVNITQTKVNEIIDKLHRGKHIDDITKKWLA